MPLECVQRPRISAGDTDVASIDFTPFLDSGELLTGTPTIVEVTSSDLTLGNKVVSTTALTIDGNSVAAGAAVQFSVSGQVASTTYRIRITATTDATVARTKVVDVLLECVETRT